MTDLGWLFKPAVFLLCARPIVLLAYNLWLVLTQRDASALGTDPKQALLHETGQTALIILLITLSITPMRRIFGVNRIQRVRRMLGVWVFAYALAHLTIYLGFDQLCFSPAGCQWADIWQDILKRRFIFVGQLAFLCLLLLAITSTAGWQRRLKKNWTRLHRIVYVAAAAGVIHFIWIQKSDIGEPLKFAFVLAGLMLIRIYWTVTKRLRRADRAVTI